MKFKIDCDSPLLQKSLEYMLKDYLSNDGIIISDNPQKGEILIGKDIKKPFTKESILLKFERELSFEEKLDKLIEEFKENLKNLIKDYYGKK